MLLVSQFQAESQNPFKDGIWLPKSYLDSMNVCETEKEAYNRFLNPIQALLLNKGKFEILLFEQEVFQISLRHLSKNQYLITEKRVNIDSNLGFDDKLSDKNTNLIFNTDTSIDVLFYYKNQITRKVHMVKYNQSIHQNDPLALFYENKLKGKYTLFDDNRQKIDNWYIGNNFNLKSTLFNSLELFHLPGGCLNCIALPTFRLKAKNGITKEIKLKYSKGAIYFYVEKNRKRTLSYVLTKVL